MSKPSGITIATNAMAVLRMKPLAGQFRRKRGSIPRPLPRLYTGTIYAYLIFEQADERPISIRTRSTISAPRGRWAPTTSKLAEEPAKTAGRSIGKISVTQVSTDSPSHIVRRIESIAP
jgi:hypothetical protein